MRCGLVHWCERARLLAAAMPATWNVRLGVLGDPFDAADCPGALELPVSAELRTALHGCPEVDGQRRHGARVQDVEHRWGRWQ
eukprot:5388097-Prymnesium_polylepis.1